MCDKEGPKGNCQKESGHSGMHGWKDGYGKTSMWGNDWKKNDNRTTWRA